MAGFDDLGVYYSDNFGTQEPSIDENQVNLNNVKKKFKDFIQKFNLSRFAFEYRDQLLRNYNCGNYWLEISIDDLSAVDEKLADQLQQQPTEYFPLLEEAAKEVVDELTRPRADDLPIQDIQVILKSDSIPSLLRDLKSNSIAKLVKIPGIIIASSGIRAKATKIAIQCRTCRTVIPNLMVKPGLDGYSLPRRCTTDQPGQTKCPLDPFFIIPDKCVCNDFQTLKLQESLESVPNGEMPRHVLLYCDRYLCDRVVPGNRVTVIGIYCIKKITKSKSSTQEKANVGIRNPYIRVLGIQIDTDGSARTANSLSVSPEEEEEFRRLAASSDVYEKITRSIAPSIYGSLDIKKALACLLFGGSRKKLPDGLTRRGDINLLLLGDPGTAKSQLLKFVERVSPIGVYTSGKGSSAAGLTASVIRDPQSRNFIMEGGAMVLADGGVVCIDEFDKMREDDRVAIHEAMEQQTISIAKAGITTTLNSRCSVLAAANSVYGRWDDTKGEANIDFMPTILSRFDMIFIVKDNHNQLRDMTLAKHVMNIHMNSVQTSDVQNDNELSLNFLKKFIAYCRSRCGPRLSESAGEKLKNRYVLMRNGARDAEMGSDKKLAIPITVRQLEAIIRIAESLAKMQLQPFTTDKHIDEALRLFQVSTLDAASSGSLAGAEGFTTEQDHETLIRIEKQLKARFAVGSQVSEHSIIQDFLKQKYNEQAIYKVIYHMIRRGEIQYRMQRKVIYRIK